MRASLNALRHQLLMSHYTTGHTVARQCWIGPAVARYPCYLVHVHHRKNSLVTGREFGTNAVCSLSKVGGRWNGSSLSDWSLVRWPRSHPSKTCLGSSASWPPPRLDGQLPSVLTWTIRGHCNSKSRSGLRSPSKVGSVVRALRGSRPWQTIAYTTTEAFNIPQALIAELTYNDSDRTASAHRRANERPLECGTKRRSLGRRLMTKFDIKCKRTI